MSNINADFGSEKVKELMEKIKNENAKGTVSQTGDGVIEFKFEEEPPKTALVFEHTDDATLPDEESEEVAPYSLPEEESAEQKAEPTLREADEEEFIIPDIFVINEEYNTPLSDDGAPMIWKTYVPRFTEASEKQYRFIDEKEREKRDAAARARAKTPEQVKEEESVTPSAPSVVTVDVVTPSFDKAQDSTAEIDSTEQLEDAVVVNVKGKASHVGESINVFKFADTPVEEKPEPSAEELERERIAGLTGHKFEKEQEASEEPQPAVELPKSEHTFNSETYEMPAPGEFFSEKYTAAVDELPEKERPRGATDTVSSTAVKGSSEFTYFTMRESVKDKFLDRIMSVRLRLVVAALVTLLVIAYENIYLFGVNASELLGFGENTFAVGVLDLCFIVGMFLIAIPESARAIGALKAGRVVPELSVILAMLSITAYTAVASVRALEYPLFGSVYAIIVLSSIFASHCLHSADFSAFKLISEKGDKSVADVRYTRELERENIALDGAVDEYKSKIARSFETSFVSKFFANTAKRCENHKNNLLILLLTFGFAVVVGAVMFFVGGEGIVSALSAFALIVSLATPAFAILSHKLPFRHAQMSLSASESAIIGEAACADAAGVDVVAFADTEIFGDDDVSFKSISLTDKKGDFRKAMRQMSSLFNALGGPLSSVFSASVGKEYPAAVNVEIEADGASGEVDGVRIMAGNADYMERHGIYVPPETGFSVESTKTMYAAEEGELFAKFSIQYSFSEEFALLLSTLREEKIVPVVYTRDPNVNGELLKFLTGDGDAIRVMKKNTVAPASEKVYGAIDSGLVTQGSKAELVSMLLVCKRYARFQSSLALTELTASVVGSVLASLIAFTVKMTLVPSIILAVWQIAWGAVLHLMSKRSFIKKEKNK